MYIYIHIDHKHIMHTYYIQSRSKAGAKKPTGVQHMYEYSRSKSRSKEFIARERQSSSEAGHTHTHRRVPHSRPATFDSPAGHAVHADPALEIRIRREQEEAMYVDPDVDKPEAVYKPIFQARVPYDLPFATTKTCVPQRYFTMTFSESALSAASAQPEGRPR
jgi:hypothetical protein